jgi:hypothetical protein
VCQFQDGPGSCKFHSRINKSKPSQGSVSADLTSLLLRGVIHQSAVNGHEPDQQRDHDDQKQSNQNVSEICLDYFQHRPEPMPTMHRAQSGGSRVFECPLLSPD